MNLDEFKGILSSEATKENEQLKKELSELRRETKTQKSKILELEESVKENLDDILVLQNRCAATTHFSICVLCGMRFRCKALERAITISGRGTSKERGVGYDIDC